jgi:hypothetical protein
MSAADALILLACGALGYVIGQRTTAGRRLYFTQTEVRDQAGVLLATGSSVHRFRGGSESAEGVPPRARGA